jgi:hypothetical protein
VVAAGVFTTTMHPGCGCGGSAAALVETAAAATEVVANNSASRFTLPPVGAGERLTPLRRLRSQPALRGHFSTGLDSLLWLVGGQVSSGVRFPDGGHLERGDGIRDRFACCQGSVWVAEHLPWMGPPWSCRSPAKLVFPAEDSCGTLPTRAGRERAIEALAGQHPSPLSAGGTRVWRDVGTPVKASRYVVLGAAVPTVSRR